MRAHAAFWEYVKACDLQHSVIYATQRDPDGDDSKWLRGRAGKKCRAKWSSLPVDEQHARITKTPDPTFPSPVMSVIHDESANKGTRPTKVPAILSASPTEVHASSGEGQVQSENAAQLKKLTLARKKWEKDTMYAAIEACGLAILA
jgi:hypothetical protein